MKSNLLTTLLSWALAVIVVLDAWFCIRFVLQTRELRNSQFQIARYQQTHAVLNRLISEVAEYSRRDPNVLPILESIGVKVQGPAGSAAATNRPSAR